MDRQKTSAPSEPHDRDRSPRESGKTGAESTAPSEPTIADRPSAPSTVPAETRRPESEWIDAEIVALAAAVEALSSGPARVLAAKLHAELVARFGTGAEVVSIASRKR